MGRYVVTLGWGSAWDPSRRRREQDGWAEHAAFMDDLAARGVVLLSGPLGADVDRGDALLVMDADDEPAVRRALAADPWAGSLLTIRRIDPWTVWLRSPSPV